MNAKALYWIALGVFALALNSEYRNGGLLTAHRLADRAEAVACQIAARAEQTLTMARMMIDRPATDMSPDEFVARHQAEIDRALAMHQAELDRALAMRQAELDRVMALRQAEFNRLQERMNRVHVVVDQVQLEKWQNLKKLQGMRFKFADSASGRTIVVCPKTGARVEVNVPNIPEISLADEN